MLPINLVYDFQLLPRGVPVYCNNQSVKLIVPVLTNTYFEGYYLLKTNQEYVYCHPAKMLSLSVVEGITPNDSKWS